MKRIQSFSSRFAKITVWINPEKAAEEYIQRYNYLFFEHFSPQKALELRSNVKVEMLRK